MPSPEAGPAIQQGQAQIRPEGFRFRKVTLYVGISEEYERQQVARCINGHTQATALLNELRLPGPATPPEALQRLGFAEGVCQLAGMAMHAAVMGATSGGATIPPNVLATPTQVSEGPMVVLIELEDMPELPPYVRADAYRTPKPTTTHVNEAGNA